MSHLGHNAKEYGGATQENKIDPAGMYDEYYGHYKDNVADHRVKSNEPAHAPAAPFTIKGDK